MHWSRLVGIASLIFILLWGGLLAYALSLPNSIEIDESITCSQEPAALYPLVADLKRWPDWVPWTPVVVEHGDVSSGKGARMSWKVEDSLGWLEIQEAEEPESVRYAMVFDGETMASGTVTLSAHENGGTRVRWEHSQKVDGIGARLGAYYAREAVTREFKQGLGTLARIGLEEEAVADEAVAPATEEE